MMRPDDLIKRCDCGERSWAKCRHGWHLLKMVNGTRRRISFDRHFGHTKIRTVAEAVTARDALLTAWRAGTLPMQPAATATGTCTLAELAGRFLTARCEDRSSSYRAVLTAHLKCIVETPSPAAGILGDLAITAITDDLLEGVLRRLAREGYSTSYRNKVLRACRQLGKWAKRKHYGAGPWLVPGECEVMRKKEARRDRRLLEHVGPEAISEEAALLAAASLPMQALIIAGIDTAARIGELLAVQWCDVSLTGKTITIRDVKTPDKPVRTIPLTGRLAAVLAFRRLGPDGLAHDPAAFVFGNEVGEPIGSVLTAWENTVLRAHGHSVTRHPVSHTLGAEARAAYRAINLRFHDMRHEAISRWAEAGIQPNLLMEWTGHTNLETLSIYINKARKRFAAAAMAEAERHSADSPWATLPSNEEGRLQ